MIDKTAAKKQVARLSQMYGYPRGEDQATALNELVKAVEGSASVAMAEKVVSSILDTAVEDSRCPMPATLRGLLYDAAKAANHKPECVACNNTGFRVEFRLISYAGKSLQVETIDALPGYGFIEAEGLRRKLRDGQDVISTAVPCSCRHGSPIARQAPFCKRCQDFGYYGGQLRGEFAGVWKWCDCRAGQDAALNNPAIVDESNEARLKLLAIPTGDTARGGYRNLAEVL